MTTTTCQCGCGFEPRDGKAFVHGHWTRTEAARAMFANRVVHIPPPNPGGLCMCGCGGKTPLAKKSRVGRGTVKGQSMRYIPNHHTRGKTGALASRWKGGRSKRSDGYITVLMPEHPGADVNGYVMEHRVVAEKTIGRFLYKHEVVHHLDHDKTNNAPDNLQVMSRREHALLHPLQSLVRHYEIHDIADIKDQASIAGKKGADARWCKRGGAKSARTSQ